MFKFLRRFNIVSECNSFHLALWSCPPFLFIIIGLVNMSAILVSYFFAASYIEDPQYVVVIVSVVAAVIFIIGHSIVHGFSRIAEANRFKTEFIAIVSHQLRSPLSIFKWSLNALEHYKSAASPNTANPGAAGHEAYLDILNENTEKMIQLVNMLLEVSRIEAGSLILRCDPVRLDILTEAAVRSFAAYARASNIALDYAAPAVVQPVCGDAEKIKMVVQNLMDNAIRYSLSGGRVVVTVAPRHPGMVEWRIQDAGAGIPKEQQRYIFQKFFRAEKFSTNQVRGWGLGLYVAHSIIDALEGAIGFESTEGQGSSFWFRLPIFKI